ncbi:S-adenosyl-L-methionine-dependent methyltransferase [Sporodiniella umbellata]|nr:S-adenosyl-L-methionine-dependent methyltransferase [Sporodiniella umbellata]
MGIKQSKYNRQRQDSRRKSVNTNATSVVSDSNNSITIGGRQYHTDDTITCILPKDEIEQDRLNSQHFSVKALFEGNNVLESIEALLPRNAAVLDLGCGTGCWVLEMATDHPEYRFTGVDIAEMFPTTIRPDNIQFERLNIVQGLPYPDNTFDFVNVRLMLSAFCVDEWPMVIKDIYRVLKPGGAVELMETRFPEKDRIPIVDKLNQTFYQVMLENNKDPCISAKLGSLLQESNFELLDVQERFVRYKTPLGAVAKEMLGNWKLALLGLQPVLAERLVENPDEYEAFIDSYIKGILEEQWAPCFLAFAARKPIDTNAPLKTNNTDAA